MGGRTSGRFKKIKDNIKDYIPLRQFNPAVGDLKLTTDASFSGIGALMEQKDEKGNFYPLEFFSKSLTSFQKKTIPLEKLKLLLPLKQWSTSNNFY